MSESDHDMRKIMYDYPFYSPKRLHAFLQGRGGNIRKRWGQNFMIDRNMAGRIATEILNRSSGGICEIGPGAGAITYCLLEAGRAVHALEIDPILVAALEEELKPQYPLLEISYGDAFIVLEQTLKSHSFVCGNLPYYASTDFLVTIARSKHCTGGVFLLQDEFAQRAGASTSDSSLGVFLSNFGQWKSGFRVLPTVFYPAPRVNSRMLYYARHPEGTRCDPLALEHLLRISFGKRRKVILNSWKKSVSDRWDIDTLREAARETGISETDRAEAIAGEKFYEMVHILGTIGNTMGSDVV